VTATTLLDEVVARVREHPGLRGKAAIGMVADVLGTTDWLAGPGDDGAVVGDGERSLVVGGEAMLPPFVEADPFGAGLSAVLANVNDLCAMRGRPLADDVRLLPLLAESGDCAAAKDVSMAGLLGSLAMLLEPTRLGATVDLGALPRPPGVSLPHWVVAFPAFAFLLCVPPGAVQRCRQRFVEHGLTCEAVAVLDGSGELRVRLGGEQALVWDLNREQVTGLARPTGR
jgi:selenophosphate synthetase-related protein